MKKSLRSGIGILLALATALGSAASDNVGDAASVRAAFAAKVEAATKAGDFAIAGNDGWLFMVPELHYLSVGPFWGDDAVKVSKVSPFPADPLPAIVDFKQQLDKLGIELLVVPVPGKAAIYPDKLVDGASTDVADRVDQAQADFLAVLNKNGVKTIDLTPIYLQYRKDHPDILLYSKEDTHWSGAGLDLAADAIASVIKSDSWYASVPKDQFTASPTKVVAKGDLVAMLKSGAPDAETFNLTTVKQLVGGKPTDIVFKNDSPLILLGDSHNLIYSVGADMLATGSGFPESLSQKLGFVPGVVATRGSGGTPARQLILKNGVSLAKTKMIVWCFTSREFTEGQGWKKVLITKPSN